MLFLVVLVCVFFYFIYVYCVDNNVFLGFFYSMRYVEGIIWMIGGDFGFFIEVIFKGIGGFVGILVSYLEIVIKIIIIGNIVNCFKKNDGKEVSYSCLFVVIFGFVKMGGEVIQIVVDEDCLNGKSFNIGEGRWEMLVLCMDGQQNFFYFVDVCFCEGKG